MATNTPSEFHDFNRFVTERLANVDSGLSLEESVAAFRAYQAELEKCHEALQPAIDEMDETGGTVLDMESIIARGKQMLAEEGITG